MKKEIDRSILHKLYVLCEIGLSFLTAAVAIMFIAAIANIYYSAGEVIYSREIVKSKLDELTVPIVLWLAGVVGCFVFSLIIKKEETNSGIAGRDSLAPINALKKRMPAACPQCVEKEYAAFNAVLAAKQIMYLIATCFAVFTAIYTIVYMANSANFLCGVNEDILNLAKSIFPLLFLSFSLFILPVVFEKATAKKQLERIRKIVIAGKGMDVKVYPAIQKFQAIQNCIEKNNNKILNIGRIAIAVIAVTLIIVGVFNKGITDVLVKAINICTECIGMG